MKRRGMTKPRALIALLLTAVVAAGLIVSGAAGEVVHAGNLNISIEGGISPKKLSRHTPTPITLKVKGSISTSDGSHVPALKTVDLQFDKHGSLNTKGLPTCNPSKLQASRTAQALKACKAALVGRGSVSAEIALPEQRPFNASGPLLIFNGNPQGGKQVLVFHVFADVPAPTAFVTEGVISKIHGKYGTEAKIKIPTIVGGQGSLTSFQATLNKTWTYKHQKQSLLLATCPTGVLYAHGVFEFATTKVEGNITKPCTPGH